MKIIRTIDPIHIIYEDEVGTFVGVKPNHWYYQFMVIERQKVVREYVEHQAKQQSARNRRAASRVPRDR